MPIRSFFTQFRERVFGSTKNPCDRFASFELLLEALSNDASHAYNPAFLCLYERFMPVLRQVARKFKGRDEETLDALNTVLISVRQQLRDGKRFESEIQLRNYIWKALTYKLIDNVKASQRLHLEYDENLTFVQAATEPDITYLMATEAVMGALKNISGGCQEKLLWLSEGHSYAEIAAWRQTNPTLMRQQIRECRAKLKAELQKLGITVDWPRKKNKNAPNPDADTPDADS